MCVSQPTKLKVWRPDTDSEGKISIRSPDGQSEDVSWAAGKATAAWPAGLPVKNSVEYQIEWAGTGDKAKVTFVTVQTSPADLVGAAQMLIENGCQNQLDLLVESASKGGK